MEQLKPLSGWEDWARGKTLRRRLDYDSDYMKTRSKKKKPLKGGRPGEKEPNVDGCGYSKMVGQNLHLISLVGVSVHGTRCSFRQTT